MQKAILRQVNFGRQGGGGNACVNILTNGADSGDNAAVEGWHKSFFPQQVIENCICQHMKSIAIRKNLLPGDLQRFYQGLNVFSTKILYGLSL